MEESFNANGLRLLLKESDGYISKLHSDANIKDKIIKSTEDRNETLGVELYRCYSSVDKMNATMNSL